MSLSAGSVSATLRGNFSPAGFLAFDSAIKHSAATMDGAEKRMTAAGSRGGKALSAIGKAGGLAAAGGILAFGLAVGKSVSLAADFEAQLSSLKSVSGATGKQLQILKKDAMAAGAATKFSALDAAKAQTELAKGGLKVAEIHGGALKAALSLAAAGELDLADAASTTVNAMKQFGLQGKDAGHIADALATAANSTTSDVSDLALALRQGGGVASMAGASFDETVAAISALSDASVKGADAGTSLKAFFLNIATPSKKSAEAMKGLGLNIFKTNGDLKSMPGIAASVRSAFSGLTKEQFLNKAGTIAGSDAARALFAIYKAGPDGMRGYLRAQQEVGSAAKVAAEKQDNLKGKIENLKGSLETAGIALGEGLLGPLSEGAGSLTDTINKMVASGDVEAFGKSLGKVADGVISAMPAMAAAVQAGFAAFGPAIKVAEAAILTIIGPIAGALVAVNALVDAFNFLNIEKITGIPDIPTDGLNKARDDVKNVAESIRKDLLGINTTATPTIKVKGDVSQAVAALKRVQGMGLNAKVMKVLTTGDQTVAQKIKALENLGIGPKTAKILADNSQAIAGARSVQAALAAIQDKRVTIETTRIENVRRTGSASPGADTGRRATGRPPGSAERALVGEGRGPELVTDGASSYVVDRPTIVDLAPEDAVIPFGDPAQSGRAMGLMLAMFGIEGYAKGKKAKKKTAALPIPDAVAFGAVPEDELQNTRDNARDGYQKRKDRVHDLNVDIRAQKKKVTDAKPGKAKNAARAKLADLQRDHKRYLSGEGKLQSLSQMRKAWTDMEAQVKALHATNLAIEQLNTRQETDRTKMATASKRGDLAGWTAARDDRATLLGKLRARYAKAVELAKPDSNFAADLEGKLASVEGDIADAASDTFDGEAPSLFEGGLSAEERKQLDALNAGVSLAALTTGLEDDTAAAGAKQGFLEQMLAAAQADPARGGNAAIADLADQVKAARDNVASLTSSGGTSTNDNADLQAQITQRDSQLAAANESARVNAAALTAFRGAGDIGSAGWRPSVTQNFSMLVPSDPAVLRVVGDAAIGGLNLQAFQPSKRTTTGV